MKLPEDRAPTPFLIKIRWLLIQRIASQLQERFLSQVSAEIIRNPQAELPPILLVARHWLPETGVIHKMLFRNNRRFPILLRGTLIKSLKLILMLPKENISRVKLLKAITVQDQHRNIQNRLIIPQQVEKLAHLSRELIQVLRTDKPIRGHSRIITAVILSHQVITTMSSRTISLPDHPVILIRSLHVRVRALNLQIHRRAIRHPLIQVVKAVAVIQRRPGRVAADLPHHPVRVVVGRILHRHDQVGLQAHPRQVPEVVRVDQGEAGNRNLNNCNLLNH